MSDVIRIKMTLSTRYAGSAVEEIYEVDREDWESMTESQKDKYVDDLYEDFLANENQGGVEIID